MTARLDHDEPGSAVASGAPDDGRRWSQHLPTAFAALAIVAARWWIGHRRHVIHLVPDEPGQLAIARFLGRGERWNLLDHSTWRPLYGALLAPATWFTDDPVAVYRAGLALNAVLGGVGCVLLAVLARRLTGRSRAVCAGLALVVALAPALLFTTAWVWSESLLQVTLLVFLLAAIAFLHAGRTVWGVVIVAAAAVGFATHSRLLVLSISALVLVTVAAVRGIVRWVTAGGLAALLVVLLVAVARWSSWLVSNIWEDPAPTNTASSVLAQLGDPGSIAIAVLGQTWYQLVVTVGLAGVGLLALGRAAVRRAAERRPGEPSATDARIVLTAVLPLAALSMVFMSDRWRPDQIVYGRYNDPALAVVVLTGLGALLAASRRRIAVDGAVTLGALVASAAALWLAKRNELTATSLLRPMVLGLVPFTQRARLDVPAVTVGAAVVTVAVLLVAAFVPRSARPVAVIGLGLGLVVAGAVRSRPVIDASVDQWARVATLQEVELPDRIVVRDRVGQSDAVSRGTQRVRLLIYEFYLPDHEVVLDGDPAGADSPFVFAPLDDDALNAGDAELLWRDPAVAIGLWREP